MVNASQIRARLSDWLEGRISLSEFEDWFVPATWNIHNSDASVEKLVDEIELRLSEYSGGYLEPKQLREELRAVVDAGRPSSPLVCNILWVMPNGIPVLSEARTVVLPKTRKSPGTKKSNYSAASSAISICLNYELA